MVDVVMLLPVAATEGGCPQWASARRDEEEASVAPRGTIEKNLVNGLGPGRREISSPPRPSLQRRRGPKETPLITRLGQIHGRNLQEPRPPPCWLGKAIAGKAV